MVKSDTFEPTIPKGYKSDFTERIIELIKDDPELHDASVRLMDSITELNKEKAIRMRERRTHIDIVR